MIEECPCPNPGACGYVTSCGTGGPGDGIKCRALNEHLERDWGTLRCSPEEGGRGHEPKGAGQ
jgi:hypothetical protein